MKTLYIYIYTVLEVLGTCSFGGFYLLGIEFRKPVPRSTMVVFDDRRVEYQSSIDSFWLIYVEMEWPSETCHWRSHQILKMGFLFELGNIVSRFCSARFPNWSCLPVWFEGCQR